jgi:putative phage-type endonuclease
VSDRAFRRLKVVQHSAEWDELHLNGVSSSQIPVIMGNRPGLLELWAAQTGATKQEMEIGPDLAELFEIGLLLEDDLAELYRRRTDRKAHAVNQMLESRAVPWARASLDREVPGADRVVELKTALNRGWKDGPETVPAAVQDQVMWQLFVTGWDVADVAVLEGGRFHIYELGRDDGYIDDLLYAARWFRELVEKREMPPVDGSASSHRTLRRLYPNASGDVQLLVGEDPLWDEIARSWQEAEAAEKTARAAMSAIKAAARQLIAEGTGVQSEPGGYLITLKNTRSIDWHAVADDVSDGLTDEVELLRFAELIHENTHTDWQALCKTLRVRPKVIDAHATADGPRRFYTRFKAAPAADVVPGEAEEQEEQAA